MLIYCCRSERYMGMWENDNYHGAGIMVAKNKFYYSGVFANGEKNVSHSQRGTCKW